MSESAKPRTIGDGSRFALAQWPDQDRVSARPRGLCPVCNRPVVLRKDGALGAHGGPLGSGTSPRNRSLRCDGVGRDPLVVRRPS